MDSLSVYLERNSAVLEWHGSLLLFCSGVALGLLFWGLVGFALLRGR